MLPAILLPANAAALAAIDAEIDAAADAFTIKLMKEFDDGTYALPWSEVKRLLAEGGARPPRESKETPDICRCAGISIDEWSGYLCPKCEEEDNRDSDEESREWFRAEGRKKP